MGKSIQLNNLDIVLSDKWHKLFFTILFFITSLIIKAQTTDLIDSLLIKTHYQNHTLGDINGAIETAFKAIELSEKIEYERGLETGYYTIAILLADSENYEKSIDYIEKAKKYKDYLNDHSDAEFNLLLLQSSNYYELGFASLATSYYQQAKNTMLKEKLYGKRIHYLMILYMKAGLGYENLDSQYVYYLKAREINKSTDHLPKDFPKSEILIKRAEINEKLGSFHLQKNNLDSARYYYNQSLEAGIEMESKFAQALSLGFIAKLLEKEEKYSEALENLDKSETILKTHAMFRNLVSVYEVKQRIYSRLGNSEMEIKYSTLYKELSDSLNNAQTKGREKTVMSIISEKELEINRSKTAHKKLIATTTTSAFLFLVFGFFFFRRYKKKKQQLINEKEQTISEKEVEAINLHKKINESFEDIILMAKKNDPQFWFRFQEVYPEFKENLLQKSKELTKSELILASYIYMGFTTNEIAEMTFRTAKTVENTRYNLRKKLKLPTEVNIQIWLEGLGKPV